MSRARLLTASLVALLAASSAAAADGGVALALNLPDDNPVHRDFASGIVAEASARWRMLSPQLDPSVSVKCGAEQDCLMANAFETRGASHLLVVGVAGLGPRDFVVSIQVFDARERRELLGYSDVHRAGADPRGAGRTLAAAKLAGLTGLPRFTAAAPTRQTDGAPRPQPPPVIEDAAASPTWIGYAGLGAVAASVAIAAAAGTIGYLGISTRPPLIDPAHAQVAGVGGAAVASALFVGGVSALVADSFAHP